MSQQNQQHGQQAQQANPAQAAPMGQITQPQNPVPVPDPAQQPYPPAGGTPQPQKNVAANASTEPPLTVEAVAWLPFLKAVIATAPRVDAKLPQNEQPRQPKYIGRP